jgi:hypothetical protein
VYQKLLEFYSAAFDISTKKEVRKIVAAGLKDAHLPAIIDEFLEYSARLKETVNKATMDMTREMQEMLCDQQSMVLTLLLLLGGS